MTVHSSTWWARKMAGALTIGQLEPIVAELMRSVREDEAASCLRAHELGMTDAERKRALVDRLKMSKAHDPA